MKINYFNYIDIISFLENYPDFSPVGIIPFAYDSDLLSFEYALEDVSGLSFSTQANAFAYLNFLEWDSDNNYYVFKEHAQELLRVLYNRFGRSYFVKSRSDDPIDIKEEAKVKMNALVSILNMTYNKYATLLDNLETLKNKLINPKESGYHSTTETSGNGSNRFNDTPQNTGAFDTDPYTTNFNESETTGDSETTSENTVNDLYNVEKIAMLEDKYRIVLLNWSNEFKRLFMMEANYE